MKGENTRTGEVGYFEVVATFSRVADSILVITFSDGSVLEATDDHPFRTGDEWTQAKDLFVTQQINLSDYGQIDILHIQRVNKPTTVYNFTVDEAHTYYVGDNEVLVHNACFTGDQSALIDLAKQAQRKKGISKKEADTLLDWADEYGLPHRGPEAHPNRQYGKNLHIHIDRISG